MTKLESAKMIVKQKGSCIDIQCSECCLLPNNCSSRTANRQLAKEYVKEHESVSTRMIKLEQIKQISEKGCEGISCSECAFKQTCSGGSKLLAKSVLNLLSYDSDLSKCRVGDLIWTTQSGWSRIKKVYEDAYYPIVLDKGGTYTLGGKFAISDIAPTAFITPPLCFNPGPKPKPGSICKLKKGDKVLASNNPSSEKSYRYFAEYKPNNKRPYLCFVNGGDEWSSRGKTVGWKCCEAYKETSSTNIIPISEGTVLPDGGIVACKHNGYWLVVAPATQRGSNIRFGLYKTDTSLIAVTDVAIPDPQDGKLNTDVLTSPTYSTIYDGYGSVGCPAAEFCRALSADYFLPNKEELLAIQAVAADIDAADTSGGSDTFASIGTDYIWTSTKCNYFYSWTVRANDSSVYSLIRYYACRVVPIRRIAI